MALIKKIDVKDYLSSPKRNGFRAYRPASQPDATGFSGESSIRADSNGTTDALDQSSASGMHSPHAKTQTDSRQVAPLETSKSAQA